MATKKTAYTATFADGVVRTRKSHREYQAAWRATKDGREQVGFSGDVALAEAQRGYWAKHGWSFEIVPAVKV